MVIESAVFEFGGVEFGGSTYGDPSRTWRTFEWDPGTSALATSDTLLRTGRLAFGRDTPQPQPWRFRFRTRRGGDESAAQEQVARLMAAWRPDGLDKPLTDWPLTYTLAGRRRRIYGRPRDFSLPSTDVMVAQGLVDVVAVFQPTDPLHYADTPTRIEIGSVPASTGGLLAPLVAPLSTLRSGTPDTRFATVGGDAPTPLTVTFRGPISRPWIRLGATTVALTGSLAYDAAVTIDARTRTCLWSAGRTGSAAGLLDPRARLAELTLTPGTHEVQFGGTDQTGTATCEVSWHDAWRSL